MKGILALFHNIQVILYPAIPLEPSRMKVIKNTDPS